MISDGLLPSLQELSEWRELIAIKRKIDKCGSPQHRLVNAVLDYNIIDFKYEWWYSFAIDWKDHEYVFYLPEGSITNEYNIDLE